MASSCPLALKARSPAPRAAPDTRELHRTPDPRVSQPQKCFPKLKNLITALKILRYVEKLDGENEILVSGLALMLVDLT